MLRLKLFSLGLLAAICLTAQTPQQEINEQVWKPFIRYFSEGNSAAFMDLHSKSVVRLGIEGDVSVTRWSEYLDYQRKNDERDKKSGRKTGIDLRFDYRSVTDTFAYEIGYYHTFAVQRDGKQLDYYGKFNVILRKESGVWKILLDADHGGVTKADFENAKPMDAAVGKKKRKKK